MIEFLRHPEHPFAQVRAQERRESGAPSVQERGGVRVNFQGWKSTIKEETRNVWGGLGVIVTSLNRTERD